MISLVKAFKSSDGKTFEDVQKHELRIILNDTAGATADSVLDTLVEKKAQIIDILTTGPRSKTKARSINGGRKNRTPKLERTITASETAA